MAIKVFFKRYVKKDKTEDTLALLNEVRSQALKQRDTFPVKPW